MANRMQTQVLNWIEKANSQEELLAELVSYTEAAKSQTSKAAKFQEFALKVIEKLAINKGRPAGGVPSLGDHIMTEQHHRIANYGERAYCLSEKQMAVIIRENWDYIKS